MKNEEEVQRVVRSTRINWYATPAEMLGEETVVVRPADRTTWQEEEQANVGIGFFFLDVRDNRATLCLMQCERPGQWSSVAIPQLLSPLSKEDMDRCIEEAGGDLSLPAMYPLDRWAIRSLRDRYEER